MTEEIIIDGVDVSKCEYRDWRNLCHCDNTKENAVEESTTGRYGCDYNPNCHFKQLKRKEQALDEIEDIADDYNRVGKTSQYYRDGFDEIQDIINKAK